MQNYFDLVQERFGGASIQVVDLSIFHYIVAIVLSIAFALLVKFVYKRAFRGAMYNNSMASSLSVVLIVTTFITMAISVQPALSIGMIGALSIVRFRTAVKDAMDIAYMFWAISIGITLGAGMFVLSIILFSVVTGMMFFLKLHKKNDNSYLLVVNCDPKADDRGIFSVIGNSTKMYKLKSQSVEESNKEITVEIELSAPPARLIETVTAVDTVRNAVLLSYDGDYIA